MIYINVNTTKEVIFTLYSNSSNITNPYYTFQLINKDSEATYVFSQLDHSMCPYQYNAFTFSISNTQSGLTAGIINVDHGQYTYNVFEMSNPYDLNLNNSLGLVETGILTVVPTFSAITVYTQSNADIITVYKNLDRI